MGQTAEPEEKKENMEKTDSAPIEAPGDTVQEESEDKKSEGAADEASEPVTAETSATEIPDEETPDAEIPDKETPNAEIPDKETPDKEAPDEKAPDAGDTGGEEKKSSAAEKVVPFTPKTEKTSAEEDDEDYDEDEDDEYEEDEEDEEETESLRAWLLFLLVSAVIAAVVCGLGFGCTVRKVYVSGNSLYTSEEIAERVISDDSLLRHNSVFLTALYMTPFAPQIPFEEEVKVSLASYDAIRITVKDMDIGGFIPYTGRNLYFSPDGIIKETTPLVLKNATFVTGISVTEAEKGQKMAADNESGLAMVLEVLQTLKKYDLKADCVALTKIGNIVIYFDRIKVQLGKTDFELKISKIAQIYPYLEGRSGTINLTNYTSADENIILK